MGLECLTGAVLFYLMFMAHWQFATGVAITFRAAIFAYIFSAILGLIWVGLQSFKPQARTTILYGSISLALLAMSAFFFMQPQVSYVLVGSAEGRIAIVRGTPQAQADIIRFGEFDGAGEQQYRIRSATDAAAALKQIETVDSVSGAFVPMDAHTQDYPVLWQTSFLPDKYRNPALAFAVFGFLLLTLTIGGAQHKLHPLAVGAEFFVDTIRGIPMLVIILYIGLPLAGAVKDATGGGIDMTNMTRGIIAISVGYSAYMAEIFRSGDRGHSERATGSGQFARPVALADGAADRSATSPADRHPTIGQRVYRDDQGYLIAVHPVRPRHDPKDARVSGSKFSALCTVQYGSNSVRGTHPRLRKLPEMDRTAHGKGQPMSKLELGVCYYPEQWDPSQWRSDAARMAEMGLDWVRIAEFTWGLIEPERGRFRWGLVG